MALSKRAPWLLCLFGCGSHALDAVTGQSCADDPAQAACSSNTWPNAYSTTNSDPWLDSHADELTEMRPRLLVLDFHNPLSLSAMADVVERQVSALADGSRYHGYADPNAPAFLHYQVSKIVDLRDATPPAGWTNTSSSLVPLDGTGSFDVAALFAEPFTSKLAVADPDDPQRMLALCEQFERGLVHELWLAVGDSAPGREPPPMIECKVARDASGKRVAGNAVITTGGDACTRLPPCDVTLRIGHLSPIRGVGCDLYVRGWAIYGSTAVIPYLHDNALRYFNADLDSRYGAPFSSLEARCQNTSGDCVRYPDPDSLETVAAPVVRLQAYGQGCGSPGFPPNARFETDFASDAGVHARCEHYGLGDADGGSDAVSTYASDTVRTLDLTYPDCGGGWQMYFRQNMPGLGNRARAKDGSAMKNWWPFLFF